MVSIDSDKHLPTKQTESGRGIYINRKMVLNEEDGTNHTLAIVAAIVNSSLF